MIHDEITFTVLTVTCYLYLISTQAFSLFNQLRNLWLQLKVARDIKNIQFSIEKDENAL